MLDSDTREQLKEIFLKLEGEVVLEVFKSEHASQSELEEMLEAVAQASPRIQVRKHAALSQIPSFRVLAGGKPTGIRMTGIPGGHEFSSLVLAVLNADRKGKLPDENLQKRVGRVKGPVRLRTFVSLTCESCPDVVQALNQMAVFHEDFEHEMVEGGLAQDEVEGLGIQGVPAVFADGRLIHSGKATFSELLQKIEAHFGKKVDAKIQDLGRFDVAIIGGGPAGVSAAIYSARKGLKTALLAERMGGQLQDTKGIENFISVAYTEGPLLSHSLNEHLEKYPVLVFEQRRVEKIEQGPLKVLILEGGERLQAEQVIVTTGAKWRELGVPGEKEYLGRGVAFCPHCDGPFYQGKKIAVIGGGNSGVEAAIDLAGIVREVVLLEFNGSLRADQVLVDKLKTLPNASIVTNAKTAEVIGDGSKVTSLKFEDRATRRMQHIDLDGVFVQIGLLPNSRFLEGVVKLSPRGEVIVDDKGRTSSAGIYAAGDVTTTPYKQIIIAMGEGAKAALGAFEDRMYGPVRAYIKGREEPS